MTETTQHIPGATGVERMPLSLDWSDYRWPLLFLLSMSMLGLYFPLGYLLVPIILISRFRADRYDFLIMVTLFFGGYGFLGEGNLPVKTSDIGLIVAVIGTVIMRKNELMKKMLITILVYAVILFFLATFSEEKMSIQLRTIRGYLFFIYFIVPLMIFAGQEFDIMTFFRRLSPYIVIICWFYVFDCFIIGGHILLPNVHIWNDNVSTFFSPVLYGLGSLPRIYPQGMFILLMAMYPFARIYKPGAVQWVVFILALYATRTFSMISGLIVSYVISMPNFKRLLKYGISAVGVIAVLYLIDMTLPMKAETGESTMRIYSSMQQLFNVTDIKDDEDLAELGTGRMAQALPKLELVSEMNKEWVGLGFLHRDLTTNPKYIIDNEFYIDSAQSEEVATGVEIEPVQVYLTCGIIGLVVHLVFLALTYIYIRRYKYSYYYLTVLIGFFWIGLAGFAPLNSHLGLILCSLVFSVVVLDERSRRECDNLPEKI